MGRGIAPVLPFVFAEYSVHGVKAQFYRRAHQSPSQQIELQVI